MREKHARYQNGSIRRIVRAKGFAWEVRFSEVGATGEKNKYKSHYFSGAEYPTEADVRKALQQTVSLRNSETERVKVDANFGTITQLYRSEHLPTL
jgi:integrase